MSKIVCITIRDALMLPSGMLAESDYDGHVYLKVPDSWVSGNELSGEYREAVLEELYGQDWREGNEDGSSYLLRSFSSTVLSDKEVADRVWLQDQAQNSRDSFWYYEVSDDGQFESKEEAEQFNQ